MSELREPRRWTWEEYLEWEERQPLKYELVDGQVRAMAGGTTEHDAICNNLRFELRNRLQGKPCRQRGPDIKVRAGENSRYPDALVDCGPRWRSLWRSCSRCCCGVFGAALRRRRSSRRSREAQLRARRS